MSVRITLELVQRAGSSTVVLRGVWQPIGAQASVQRSLVRKRKLPAGVVLGEAELVRLVDSALATVYYVAPTLPLMGAELH